MASASGTDLLPPPQTRRADLVEVIHGESIADPYRWLENGDSAETRAWTETQNALTEAYLSASPARPLIRARLDELLAIGALGTPTPVRGRYFYQTRDGRQNQPVLNVRQGVHGADRVLLDPNTMNPDGTTALDWWHPSEDGRMLAYGLSEDGSEESVLHVLDVESGAVGPDRIPDTRAADVAWLPDGTGFYYTRFPARGTVADGDEHYHRAVWFHRLGTDPATDSLIFRPAEKEFWPAVSLSPDGRWLLISVSRTFEQTDLWLQDLRAGTPAVAVARDLPALFDGGVVRDRLYVRTNLRAPTYGLYEIDAERPRLDEMRELVPPRADAVLDGAAIAGDHLLLTYLERATSRLRIARRDGSAVRDHPLPGIGSLFGLGAEWDGDEAFYGFSSYTTPPSVFRIDLRTGEETLWRRVEAEVQPERFEVRQVEYRSRDGTPITMFVVQPRGVELDGNNPTYLTGYGGFNISMAPAFSRSLVFWLEWGGVVAVPNLRGGGEYGESWHQAGMLANKQNTFDDFIAAAEWLVASGYTRPRRLAVAGGSNGGLLMGAALTQRPELFGAVVIQVPLLDMLRYHRFLLARLWIPEYGSPDDPTEFRWLRSYSPYHHVRDGVSYPAVLLSTAEGDTRVDPMHARKMAARLQAASVSGRPVLVRLESRAGHGAGKPLSKVLDELTDSWTFISRELGVEVGPGTAYRSPGGGPHA
ncbi:MAG TPA: prolyl oligopeptidase family serine peptidase [Gemmatimonadales bacterium]|nr:prolyl oligopeptidase family serine peptidase [Gemmatimonadales bacterium]